MRYTRRAATRSANETDPGARGTGRDAESVAGSIVESQAFEAAFEANFQVIHRFLARRVGAELADDLAAETFAVAYRRRATFDSQRGEVRPWLFGIATVLLQAHRRRERQIFALEARLAREPPDAALGADAERSAFATSLAPRLADALAEMSAGRRDVLLLHAWGELSCEEIAVALGLRAATVRARLSRARAHLRKQLDDLDPALPRLSDKESQRLLEECKT